MKWYLYLLLTTLLLSATGCTIELRHTSPKSSGYYNGGSDYDYSHRQDEDDDYDYQGEPTFYDWDCWDSQYSYNSIIEVEAIDCDAYDIEVIVEHWDYNREYSYMGYYSGCDWFDTIDVQGYECSEIFDVTVIAYY